MKLEDCHTGDNVQIAGKIVSGPLPNGFVHVMLPRQLGEPIFRQFHVSDLPSGAPEGGPPDGGGRTMTTEQIKRNQPCLLAVTANYDSFDVFEDEQHCWIRLPAKSMSVSPRNPGSELETEITMCVPTSLLQPCPESEVQP